MKYFKTLTALALVVSLCTNCSTPDVETLPPPFEIVGADEMEKNSVNNWMKKSKNGRLKTEFDVADLQRLVDVNNGMQILSILHEANPEKALSFALGEDGNVVNAFLSETEIGSDGSVTNRIFSTDEVLKLVYVDHPDGNRSITFTAPDVSDGRTQGFWGKLNSCFGKFNGVTGYPVTDWVVTGIFNAATLGLYTPMSAVLCTGYAVLAR